MESRKKYYQAFCKDKVFTEAFSIRIGKRLKKVRERSIHKITQQDMADIIGCNRTHISAIENGHCRVTFSELLAYALVVQDSLDILFPVDFEGIEKRYLDTLPADALTDDTRDRFDTFED